MIAKLWKLIQKQWFLTVLVILIFLGMWLGGKYPPGEPESPLAWVGSSALSRWTTAIVLLLMSVTLDSGRFKQSLRYPLPVLWASVVNFVAIPLLGFCFRDLQLTRDFQVGLMVACCVPCTLAAASVWTRKGGGNDAVSLLVTLITNSSCFLVTPLWLAWLTKAETSLDVGKMIEQLVYSVLIPVLAGQLLRQIPPLTAFTTRHKTLLSAMAQCLIEVMVFTAACQAGGYLRMNGEAPDVGSVALVWGSAIVIHLLAMGIGAWGAKVMGFARPDQIAVIFASSQKTLPIGILLANSEVFQQQGLVFTLFPMLMYHASQLFIDTVVADRLSRGTPVPQSPTQATDEAILQE